MKVKNWDEFQHFKDRNPIWIKLYRKLLDDRQWYDLDPVASKLLINLWLLASENHGELPSIPDIAFRLRLPEKQVYSSLSKLSHWLIQDDINVISTCHQAVISETETETETEERKRQIPVEVPLERSPAPSGVFVWNAYSLAYEERYGVLPVRNQQTNSMCCTLVKKLGGKDAPLVAAFYLTHNDPFYVKKRHPVNLLLADAEGLRTQWATGTKATTSEAKQAELKDSVVEQAKRVEALLQGRRG